MNLKDFRSAYPQYDDIPDDDLVQSLHQKFYSDIPLADFAKSIEAPEPTASAGDYGRALMSGFAGLAEAGGKGLSYVPGLEEVGKAVQGTGKEAADSWRDSMTPAGKAALENEIITDDLGIGETPLQSIGLQALASAPSMLGAAIPGAGAAGAITKLGGKGLQELAKHPGAIGFIAKYAPSALSFGASEGAIAALQNASQTEFQVRNTPLDKLRTESPTFQRFYAETDPNLPPEQREAMAQDATAKAAADDVALKTFFSTGGIGIATGGGAMGWLQRMFGKEAAQEAAKKGFIRMVGEGAATEFAQETPQSGAEQYIQNKAIQEHVDPSTDPMKGVTSAALSGGVVGAALGGVGGAGGAILKPDPEREIAADVTSAPTVDEAIAVASAAAEASTILSLPAPERVTETLALPAPSAISPEPITVTPAGEASLPATPSGETMTAFPGGEIVPASQVKSAFSGMTLEQRARALFQQYAPETADVVDETPGIQYADPRLNRPKYRNWLKQVVATDMVEGGGIQVIPDMEAAKLRGESDVRVGIDDSRFPKTRTSSLNPSWVQTVLGATGLSVKQVRTAVEKSINGEKLGIRQAEAVRMVLDQITGERTSPENLEYVRNELQAARELRRNAKAALSDHDQAIAGIPDPYETHAGQALDESEYDPEMTSAGRTILELAEQAFAAGAPADTIIEAMESTSLAASVTRLYTLIHEAQASPEQTTETGGREIQGQPRQESGAENAPGRPAVPAEEKPREVKPGDTARAAAVEWLREHETSGTDGVNTFNVGQPPFAKKGEIEVNGPRGFKFRISDLKPSSEKSILDERNMVSPRGEPESFNERDQRIALEIKESKASGNKHVDQLPFSVEGMRGVHFKSLRDGSGGTITTVGTDDMVRYQDDNGEDGIVPRKETAEWVVDGLREVKLKRTGPGEARYIVNKKKADERLTAKSKRQSATGETSDMFGGKSDTAQAIKDREIERQKKMDEAPPVESGEGDLFSGKAKQVDVEDVAKEKPQEKKEVRNVEMTRAAFIESHRNRFVRFKGKRNIHGVESTNVIYSLKADEQYNGHLTKSADEILARIHRSLIESHLRSAQGYRLSKGSNLPSAPHERWAAERPLPDEVLADYPDLVEKYGTGKESTEDVAKPEGPKHDYSSAQVSLSKEDAVRIRSAAKRLIASDDVDPTEGLEKNPHITVKFGLHTSDSAALANVLKGESHITATVGGIEIFKNDEHDVVVLRVKSDDLHRLNKKIADNLEHTDTHPEYKPHVTLGYVKKGRGDKYADAKTWLEGKTLTFKAVEFSDKDENVTLIDLNPTDQRLVPASKRNGEKGTKNSPTSTKLVPKNTESVDQKSPILARLADKHERLGGKARARGYNSIPPRDGYEVVYKPYGEDGDRSGAGYYYAPKAEYTQMQSVVDNVSKETANAAAGKNPGDHILHTVETWAMGEGIAATDDKLRDDSRRKVLAMWDRGEGLITWDAERAKKLQAEWKKDIKKEPTQEFDFVKTFPQPLDESMREAGRAGLLDDVPEGGELEAIKGVHNETAIDLIQTLRSLEVVKDAEARGVDPNTGKPPRTENAKTQLRERIAEAKQELTQHFDDMLGSYEDAFGQDAARQFEKYVREQAEYAETKSEPRTTAPVAESQAPAASGPGEGEVATAPAGGAPSKIEDVGEKIGGARKDLAESTEPRTTREKSEVPGWRKRYQVSQIAKSAKVGEEGRWVIRDTRKEDWMGHARQIGESFATKEAAEAAIPLVAVARNHRVVPIRAERTLADIEAEIAKDRAHVEANTESSIAAKLMQRADSELRRGAITQEKYNELKSKFGESASKYQPTRTAEDSDTKWEIWRDITDRKRVKVVDQEFPTRDDAMRYIAQHAEEIIDTKTSFGEEILPIPDKVRREGPARRQGNVTGDDFRKTYGFRAVEFGNWQNQEERQQVMNHAYDALADLAEILDIPPRAIGLNGELALAFGARGHGLTGARAHYETDYGVINLTKMKGAGSLGHEWFHALDHYFGRQDTKAKRDKVKNERGDMVYPYQSRDRQFASHGFLRDKSGVRPEVRDAYRTVIETMFSKAEKYVEDTQKADKFVAATKDDVAKALASIRKDLAEQKDVTYWKRNNKPASAEQLSEFDAIAEKLIAGEMLETEWRETAEKVPRNRLSSNRWTNDALDKISAIYKAVRGRSGFGSGQSRGILDSLRGDMERYSQRLKLLASAQKGEEKTKKVPTSYVMESKSIDQGRTSEYWTTEHEMAARAFQAYVEDKIAEKGGRSDFLTYGTKGLAVPTPWGWKQPFPVGEERKAINSAFDKLIQVIESRETDEGVELFSLADEPQEPISVATQRMARFVDEAVAGKLKPEYTQLLGQTPEVLQALGANPLPLNIAGDTVLKIINGKHRHMMSAELLKQLPVFLHDPLMVFNSASKENAFVVVTGLTDKLGQPVISAIHLDVASGRYLVNEIASMYGKNNAKNVFEGWAKQGLLRYYRNEKSLAPSTTVRQLNLTDVVQAARSLKGKILTENDIVKRDPKNPDKSEFSLIGSIAAKLKPAENVAHDAQETESAADLRRGVEKALGRPLKKGSFTQVGVPEHLAGLTQVIKTIFGKEVVFFRNNIPNIIAFNGMAPRGNRTTMYLNVDAERPLVYVAGHELLHLLRRDHKDIYNKLYRLALDEFKPEQVAMFTHNLDRARQRNKQTGATTEDLVHEEMIANFIGDNFARPEFWNSLYKESPTILQRLALMVRNFVTSILKAASAKLKGYGTEHYFKDLERMRAAAVEALAEYARRTGKQTEGDVTDAEFSLAETFNTETIAKITGDSGRDYTAEQQEAFKRVGREVEIPPLKERVKHLWADAGKKLAQGLVDQFSPVKDISQEAYRLLRLSKGASGAFEVFLKGGKLKLSDNVYDFDESQRGGVIDRLLIPLQAENDDFLWWVAANRAEQLTQEDREHLFSEQDIEAIKALDKGVTDFDYTLQHGARAGQVTRDRTLIYRDALITFNEFNKNALDMAEASGLIDGESRPFWEKEFYVPFYRDEEGLRGMNIKSGVVRQQAFKQLKGGTQKINTDLLENTLQNWAHLLDAAAKNRAAKASLEAAANMGVATEVNEAGKKTVWFLDGGKKRYFRVDDPYVMTAVSAIEYGGLKGPLMEAMGQFKHWLTIGVTASPFFKIRNLIRDSMHAIGTSPLSYNLPGNVTKGFKLTHPESDEYFRLLAGGGTIHFGTMLEGSESRRVRALVEAGVDKSTILDNEGKLKAFYKRMIEPAITAYNELGNRGEAINRASLYDQLRRQGKSHAEASLLARDLLDFSMGGAWTGIRFLTQTVPFLNARLQGLYKLGRATQDDPRKLGVVLGATALFSIALMLAYVDDDDWKQREDWDRDSYWWFKIGGTAFRIPKPFEIGAMASLAERGVELFASDEMTGERFRQRLYHLLADNLSLNPVPQLVKPVLDIYANKDSFTGRPIETMGMERLRPDYRMKSSTSMAARGLSTAGNAATGDNFLSPVQVDHLVKGYFGWLGSFVVGTADKIARPATKQIPGPAPDYWKVATGGMVADKESASSRYVTQMYEQAKEIEQAYGTWRMLLKSGKTEEAREFKEENIDYLRKYPLSQRVKRQESKLNERLRLIERSNKSPEEKRRLMLNIQRQKDLIARRVSQSP